MNLSHWIVAGAGTVDELPEALQPSSALEWWMCVEYFGSADFLRLDPKTQRTRRGILEGTFDEPISPTDKTPFAEFPLPRMTAKVIRILRDRKAGLPEAANNRVKAVRRVFAWGLENEHVPNNPARDVSYVRNATVRSPGTLGHQHQPAHGAVRLAHDASGRDLHAGGGTQANGRRCSRAVGAPRAQK
jgi:hypothetical protein